jgi:hypothetical protein
VIVGAIGGACGCTGSIADQSGLEPPESTRPGDQGGTSIGPGSSKGAAGGAGGAGGGPVVAATPCASGRASPLPLARLWRLSPAQYANTVKQLFGLDVDPATLPPDGAADDQLTRFDTNSTINIVGDRLAGVYHDTANAVARAVVAGLGATPYACALMPGAADPCLQNFVRDHATRAYRRPATQPEVDRLVAYVKTQRADSDAATALRLTLEAVLQSPYFVYRTELGNAAGARVPLTPHELASELSYFVADAAPDAMLLAAAERGELSNPANVRMHAQRLLATPTARAKVRDFFATYLGVDRLDGKRKDAKFTAFTDAIKQGLTSETMTFVERTLFDDGGTLQTLFTAPHTYLNATVAKYYGLTASSATFTKVPLPAGRAGVLSQAAVIAALSNESTTSPVHRGLFYRRNMLCRVLPPPPPDASNMLDKLSDPRDPMATEREKWAYFERTTPGCAACHRLFQPLGLGLENLDPIGRWRDTDFGKPIDPGVVVKDYSPALDGSYGNGIELASKIITTPEAQSCFALQYTSYAFGRNVDQEAEACRLESLGKKLQQGNLSLQSLIVEMTQDESFYFRRYE